jgi:hypothetical protein
MMKNLTGKIVTLSSVAILLLASCKKNDALVTLSDGTTKASVLTTNTTTPALVKANLTANAVTFSSTATSYGYSAAVTYTLQLDVKGDNFATAKKVKEVVLTSLTQSYTVKDFNNMLLSMNLATGVSAQVDVRIKSSLSASSGATYSNVVTLTATPFALVSYVYIPGAYQGWDPTSADSLQSATGNGIYTGIINYVGIDFHFKVTPAKKWDVAYGDAGSGKISTSGGDILAPGAGQYFVTVDLNANTITFVKPTYYYSVIGDAAIDWNTDVDMKFNNGTLTWELTRAFVSTGGFKIRLNHDWGTSWGFLSPPDGKSLTYDNGGNMTVSPTGTYKVVFKPTYDATSGKPDKVVSYTLTKQ